MFLHSDLDELLSMEGNPAVSLYLPTHVAGREIKKRSARVLRAMRQLELTLRAALGTHGVAGEQRCNRTTDLIARLTAPTRHPAHEFVLELAFVARCDFIVTHNLRDLQAAERFGIRVVTPGEFLRTMGVEP